MIFGKKDRVVRYYFTPKPDISAFELAQILKIGISMIVNEDGYSLLADEAKRHYTHE